MASNAPACKVEALDRAAVAEAPAAPAVPVPAAVPVAPAPGMLTMVALDDPVVLEMRAPKLMIAGLFNTKNQVNITDLLLEKCGMTYPARTEASETEGPVVKTT